MPGLLRMVGRDAELTALSAAYADVAAGHSRVVLITGAAGIGKTTLVTELRLRAGPPGGAAQVRIGESAPLAGAALAYGPFVAALGDQAGWLLDGDSTSDMLTARHRLFTRVLDVLAGLAARAPLLLVLEDLHWADESSRELLAFLAVRLRELPVMIVATMREDDLPGDARRWLAELDRRPGVTRLRLAGLPDAEIARLVNDFIPNGAGADRLAAVVAAAAGNPLFARELASHGPAGMPASVTEVVLARAAGVAVPARAVIDQVCVADGGMSHDLLTATAGLTEDQLLAAVRDAVAAGLLTAAGDGYAFGHALIRQVLYGQLLPGERRVLHRRLAAALAASPGADQGRLAQHWHLAGCQDRAAAAAVIAARDAVSARAYPEAVRHYGLAIELAQWLPRAGPDLLEEAAQAASWANDPERAVTWAADALAQSGAARPATRARLLERLGRYRWESGDPRAALDTTEQAVELLAADPPSTLQARVLAAVATWRMLLGEFGPALPLARQAVKVAQESGAVAEQAHGLATLGIIQAERGELDAGLAALHASLTLALRAASIEDVVRAAANHMYLLCTAGRFAEALEVAREGRQAARSLDAPPAMTSLLDNNTAAVLTATGQWAEADQLLTELVGQSAANVTRYLQVLQLELAVGRGEGERAAELATILAKSPEDPGLAGPLHACLAEQACSAADLAVAADEVANGLAALSGGEWPAEEIRLLAVGARVSADLAVLPAVARPRGFDDRWRRMADGFAGRAREIAGRHPGQPDSWRSAPWRPPSMPASWAPMTATPGAAWPGPGRPPASPTGRLTRGCARRRPRSGPGGASRPAAPWRRARPWPGSSRRLRCWPWLTSSPAGPGSPARPVGRLARRLQAPGST